MDRHYTGIRQAAISREQRLARVFILTALWAALALLNLTAGLEAEGRPPAIDRSTKGVLVIRDDNNTPGGLGDGSTHQHTPNYQAKKVIDLATLPAEVLEITKEARVSVWFGVVDWSGNMGDGIPNGLNEEFEIVVNGHVHRYPTNCGIPPRRTRSTAPDYLGWTDFRVPVAQLVRGKNEIIFRKCPHDKNDDFIYVGIDPTARHGNSAVSFDAGKTWKTSTLNTIGATGEYMVRLVLIQKPGTFTVSWKDDQAETDNPRGILTFFGLWGHKRAAGVYRAVGPDEFIRIELDSERIDPHSPVSFRCRYSAEKPPKALWLTTGETTPPKPMPTSANGIENTLAPGPHLRPWAIEIRPEVGETITLKEMTLSAVEDCMTRHRHLNILPPMASPAGSPAARSPRCSVGKDEAVVENAYARWVFSTNGRLVVKSFRSEYLAGEVLVDPRRVDLFAVEMDGQRFGAPDFRCLSIEPLPDQKPGFVAELTHEEKNIRATLRVEAEPGPEIRFGLLLTNDSKSPVQFKLAFPVVAGIRPSPNEADDFYLLPTSGGTISKRAGTFRKPYGSPALWQMVDIYSPSKGCGVWTRVDDPEGLFKIVRFQKIIAGITGGEDLVPNIRASDEMLWKDSSLPKIDGTGVSFEYMRRTRKPGEQFAAPDVLVGVHPGDWHGAMEHYSAWAHNTWKFRPIGRRFLDVHNIAIHHLQFEDGYHAEKIDPHADLVELNSWWEWSELGPWNMSMDQFAIKMPGRWKRYLKWFPKDDKGRRWYTLNRGEYLTPRTRWGGQNGLREFIHTLQASGRFVTPYLNGKLVCGTTGIGQKYGEKLGVIASDREYAKSHDSWNACADSPEWRDLLAAVVKRVVTENDFDGVRLDEYGFNGWACHSALHTHTFAEPGCMEWLRASTEACRQARKAMDSVRPGLLLMTEYPGYDYLASVLDGALCYFVSETRESHAPPMCNLFRFYFPECRLFELDYWARRRPRTWHLTLWNGYGFFDVLPELSHRRILRENGDVFASREVEPLIPALREYVYANRFGAGDKVIFTLFNDTRKTIAGELLRIEADGPVRVFDLLLNKEIPARREGNAFYPELLLARDEAACIAIFKPIMDTKREGSRVQVKLKSLTEGMRLVAVSADGTALWEAVPERVSDVPLSYSLPEEARDAVALKLFISKYLRDAQSIPSRSHTPS